jgi:hypothetical protein
VVTGKVCELAPDATVTAAGTITSCGFALVKVTATPPAGAGPFKVTVPVTEPPPMMLAGCTVRAASATGCTIREAVAVLPYTAWTVAVVAVVTADVVTGNDAEVDPAATVIDEGAAVALESLDNDTGAPPAGAAAARVTVPVVLLPPTSDAGTMATDESAGPAASATTAVRVRP